MELSPNSLTLPLKFCFPTVASLLQQDSLDPFCLHITCSSPPETNSTNRWYLWNSARHHWACDFCPFDIFLSFFKSQLVPLQDFLFVCLFLNQMFLTITLSFLLPLAFMSVVFTLYICTCLHSALWACGASREVHDLYVPLVHTFVKSKDFILHISNMTLAHGSRHWTMSKL